MKVLFTYDYGQHHMKKVEELGYDLHITPEREVASYPHLDMIEVLCCYHPFRDLDLEKMPALKWIQLSSIGIDQLPKEAVLERKITVTNNRGGYSIPMGEWVVGKLLEMTKRSHLFYKQQEQMKWALSSEVLELHGKTIGFLGTGTIAKEAAKRLQGFDVSCVGFNTTGHPEAYFDQCAPLDQVEQFLPTLDGLVICLPSTKKTRGFMNKERLDLLPDHAMLVNVARGDLIDESALILALEKGRFLGAALDVFQTEPLPDASPLWSTPRMIITPHNSWISEKRNDRRFDLILDNLRRYREHKPLQNVVEVERGY